MENIEQYYKGRNTAITRWARFGPYYAMFPVDFAFQVIDRYSQKNDTILDPFSGRGTSLYAAAALGRSGTGIEINPLGWLYCSMKFDAPEPHLLFQRLQEIYAIRNDFAKDVLDYHEFFRMCYCDEVLQFLLAARACLAWKIDRIDRAVMGFILAYLHGDIGHSLSNQMRSTKAYNMQYSINWWKKHNMAKPPEVNPYELMTKKIAWRYAHGAPQLPACRIQLGDSVQITKDMLQEEEKKYSLLFTSPPYSGITDYYEDQWIRMWLLGYEPRPVYRGNFGNREKYRELLDNVFGNCAKLMKDDAVIYVRTDSRKFTLYTTIEILKEKFPNHDMKIRPKRIKKHVVTQTVLCGNTSKKPGEMDIILTR